MILENVCFLNEKLEFEKGDIIINNGVIEEIIPKPNTKFKTIVLPAFISTHSHFGETIFRGLTDGLNLEEYIRFTSKINNDNEALKRDIRQTSCELTITELVKQGISTVQSARTWEYVSKSPLKADLGYPLMKGRKLMQYYENFLQNFDRIYKKFNNDRIRVGLWLHSLPYVDEKILEQVSGIFNKRGLFLTIHLDETKKIAAETVKKYGETGVRVLEKYGLLNERTNLVHCIHTGEQDFNLISENDANTTLCPTTGLKLGSGLSRLDYIRLKSINYSLANDTLAANNSANFYELMKITGLVFNKLKLGVKELFSSVTKKPALTLKRFDQGIIKKGFKADFQVIQCNDTSLYPMKNILSNLIYSRTKSPSSVILDGELVVENGKVMFSSEEEKCRKMQEVFDNLSV